MPKTERTPGAGNEPPAPATLDDGGLPVAAIVDTDDRTPVDGGLYGVRVAGRVAFARYNAAQDKFDAPAWAPNATVDAADILGRVRRAVGDVARVTGGAG